MGCIDECEDLLARLEEKVAAPDVAPVVLMTLLRALKPFNEDLLSQLKLLDRLQEIARLHGGRVPLHSRLLKQWLHFAYPQDCKYPYVTGQKRQVLVKDWTDATGKLVISDED